MAPIVASVVAVIAIIVGGLLAVAAYVWAFVCVADAIDDIAWRWRGRWQRGVGDPQARVLVADIGRPGGDYTAFVERAGDTVTRVWHLRTQCPDCSRVAIQPQTSCAACGCSLVIPDGKGVSR